MSKIKFAYQIKVVIEGARPLIWRRLLVPTSFSMHELHLTIQAAFDWQNYHLFSFEKKNKPANNARVIWESEMIVDLSNPENEVLGELDSHKEKMLKYYKKPGDTMIYTYDFGDGWRHQVIMEEIFLDYKYDYPVCLKAKMHAPAEDSGSIWGWEEKISILKNPDLENPEHMEIIEWLKEMIPEISELDDPGQFDPSRADLEKINSNLKKFRDMENELID
jgi:hypothetical protein